MSPCSASSPYWHLRYQPCHGEKCQRKMVWCKRCSYVLLRQMRITGMAVNILVVPHVFMWVLLATSIRHCGLILIKLLLFMDLFIRQQWMGRIFIPSMSHVWGSLLCTWVKAFWSSSGAGRFGVLPPHQVWGIQKKYHSFAAWHRTPSVCLCAIFTCETQLGVTIVRKQYSRSQGEVSGIWWVGG